MGAEPTHHGGAAGASLDTRIYTNHFNSNCRFRGKATLAGRSYDVDALGWRDHSWGPRKWDSFPVNRVMVANFGDDLAISALAQVWTEGAITKRGQITRNGVRRPFVDFESLVLMEDDGISARSAEFTAIVEGDERLTFRIDLVGGVICKTKQRVGFDGVGECYLGDRVGFALLELNTNPRRGVELPVFALHCGLNNGVARRSPRLSPTPFAQGFARAAL
jgi:hypothetical protein